jgi:hypothetical protein
MMRGMPTNRSFIATLLASATVHLTQAEASAWKPADFPAVHIGFRCAQDRP